MPAVAPGPRNMSVKVVSGRPRQPDIESAPTFTVFLVSPALPLLLITRYWTLSLLTGPLIFIAFLSHILILVFFAYFLGAFPDFIFQLADWSSHFWRYVLGASLFWAQQVFLCRQLHCYFLSSPGSLKTREFMSEVFYGQNLFPLGSCLLFLLVSIFH